VLVDATKDFGDVPPECSVQFTKALNDANNSPTCLTYTRAEFSGHTLTILKQRVCVSST
jgi:hypothetical protein